MFYPSVTVYFNSAAFTAQYLKVLKWREVLVQNGFVHSSPALNKKWFFIKDFSKCDQIRRFTLFCAALSKYNQKSRLVVFYKKISWKSLQSSQKNTSVGTSFFNKVAGYRPVLLFKRDFDMGVFLYISRNFLRICFLQNTSK